MDDIQINLNEKIEPEGFRRETDKKEADKLDQQIDTGTNNLVVDPGTQGIDEKMNSNTGD